MREDALVHGNACIRAVQQYLIETAIQGQPESALRARCVPRKIENQIHECCDRPGTLVGFRQRKGVLPPQRIQSLGVQLIFQVDDSVQLFPKPRQLFQVNPSMVMEERLQALLHPGIQLVQVGGSNGLFDLLEVQALIDLLLQSLEKACQLGSIQEFGNNSCHRTDLLQSRSVAKQIENVS